MIPYILECIAFQLVFLIIYDLFLKRETFFQWNRGYLIGTYSVSMVLPWIKIEALKSEVPLLLGSYPDDFWNTFDAAIVTGNELVSSTPTWPYILFFLGAIAATAFFSYKLYQIYRLRRNGDVRTHKEFTEVVVPDSLVAFSFFNFIFLGDKISKKSYHGIVAHELVHIRQKHSYDLLFFELMRIMVWFNPLVYLYQRRVSELHEFIADARVSGTSKKEQYELLLSQVFQTQHISFINQFFKTSLIKKRIVMLKKEKSNRIVKFKYLFIVPLVLAMLAFTSSRNSIGLISNSTPSEAESIRKYGANDTLMAFAEVDKAPIFPGCENEDDTKECFKKRVFQHISKHFNYPKEAEEKGIHGQVNTLFTISEDGSIQNIKLRGPHKLLENEVKRIISRLPKMKPGIHEGKKVNVGFSVPIMFKLDESTTVDLFKKGTEGLEPIFMVNGKSSSQAEVRAIDPDDIEYMSVLKGEAAKKQYGEKGKNGVVQITLKKN